MDASVNTKFLKWLNKKYGSLGINSDFCEKGKVMVDMIEYIKGVITVHAQMG